MAFVGFIFKPPVICYA